MPTRPTRHVAPGTRTKAERQRDNDKARRIEHGWRALYGTARWKRLAAAQLASQPLCAACNADGRTVPATTCDHVTAHRGDLVAFWAGPFQSLCTRCHSSAKQRQEAQQRPSVV